MPMTKGVEGSLAADSARPPRHSHSGETPGQVEGEDERGGHVVRRRRRNRHHRHQNLTRRSGRGVEIAFVTVLAVAILFAILYYLLPHYQAQGRGEESHLVPHAAPAGGAIISPRAVGPS